MLLMIVATTSLVLNSPLGHFGDCSCGFGGEDLGGELALAGGHFGFVEAEDSYVEEHLACFWDRDEDVLELEDFERGRLLLASFWLRWLLFYIVFRKVFGRFEIGKRGYR